MPTAPRSRPGPRTSFPPCRSIPEATANSTSGFVEGNLRKQIDANGTVTKTFEVGTGSDYTPIGVTILGVGGSKQDNTTWVQATTTNTEHPSIGTSDINSSLDANRYWTLS